MSASVGNTINHALPRLHDIEAISCDIGPPLDLRLRCADSVVAEWNSYASYANFNHTPDTKTQSKKPLPNESEPSLGLLFKDANDYSLYMKRNGTWGSYLEAEVIAKTLEIPLLIWNKHTRRCYNILNYRPYINTCASTNSYDLFEWKSL
jgi:hypothetical protein